MGTSEKLFNDEFETQLLLASFCNTDTLYPYNCKDYHSDLAKKYNTTVSPNIAGLSDYQSSNSRWVTYTYDVVSPYFDDSAYSDALATTNSKISQYNKDLGTINDSIKAINLSNKALGIVQKEEKRAQNRDNLNRSILSGIINIGVRLVATAGAVTAAAGCTPESFGTLAVPCAIAAYGSIEGAGGALANASSQYIETGKVDATPVVIDGLISGTVGVAIPYASGEIGAIRGGLAAKTSVNELSQPFEKMPLGKGNTGNLPTNLNEQMIIKQAVSDAKNGTIITRIELNDARWPASEGWVKMRQTVNGREVHYVYNKETGQIDDFKIIP